MFFLTLVYLAENSRLPVTHDVMQIACLETLCWGGECPCLSKRFGQMGETCCVHIVYTRGSFEGEESLQKMFQEYLGKFNKFDA